MPDEEMASGRAETYSEAQDLNDKLDTLADQFGSFGNERIDQESVNDVVQQRMQALTSDNGDHSSKFFDLFKDDLSAVQSCDEVKNDLIGLKDVIEKEILSDNSNLSEMWRDILSSQESLNWRREEVSGLLSTLPQVD